jgi:hypothetical protein
VSADDQGQAPASPAEQPTLTHSQCINRLQEIRDAMGSIAELERPSGEDDRYFQELTAEFDRTDAWRKKLEKDAQLARVRSTAEGLNARAGLRAVPGAYGNSASGDGYDSDAILNPDSIESKRFRNPWDLSEMRTWGRSREEVNAEYRARALSAIETMPSTNDRVRSTATDIVERFDDNSATLSRLALTASSPEYLRAFGKAATNRLHELSVDEQRVAQRHPADRPSGRGHRRRLERCVRGCGVVVVGRRGHPGLGRRAHVRPAHHPRVQGRRVRARVHRGVAGHGQRRC